MPCTFTGLCSGAKVASASMSAITAGVITTELEKRTGVACEFRTNGLSPDRRALPAGVPLAAYRTAQEALTNVSKHAGATRVVVDLSISGGVLSLEVSDDGRGLSAGDLAKTRSFGIRGLHERASTVGGWVDLSSNPSGTTLILSVPLEAAHAVVADAQDSEERAVRQPSGVHDAESQAWSTR